MQIKKVVSKLYRKAMKYLPQNIAMRIDYLRGYGKVLNIKNPQTFGEKIQWIKLYGNIEKYSNVVDKYEVRKFIEETIGSKYLPKLYGVYDKVEEIDFDELPNKFVLKCNHGCGYNIICNDKSSIDKNVISQKLNKWLKEEFYKEAKENQYKGIKPKIVCEEYLEDKSGSLIDYKYFCFDGNPKFIQVISDRGSDTKSNFYDLYWNRIHLRTKLKNSEKEFEKPENLLEMNELSKILSEQYPFVRVDFYNINGRIVFGELTFTPGGGVSKFRPIEKDYEIAKMINLDKYNN